MIALSISFAVGALIGSGIVWAATRHKIRQTQAEALALLFPRHSIDASSEDAIRRAGC